MVGYKEMNEIPTHITYQAKQDTPIAEIPTELKWSSLTMPVPAVGTVVHVRINRIGFARVERYFIEDGFLGLLVLPLAPPEWYVKQNGRSTPAHVFGTEIDPMPEVRPERLVTAKVLQGFSVRVVNGVKKRFTVEVRDINGRPLLNGREERTTAELAVKLAERFCKKNDLVLYAVEVPS